MSAAVGKAGAAAGPGDEAGVTELKRLSLEELANVEVTSVEKRRERLADTAAAVYVLTGEDVERSGAATLAESLRWVPGVQVARIDAHNWGVSSRGFTDVFANKLLVLVDGRSVYTPLYSGVFWQYEDVLLEDLERIEIVRGPGATVWGANAVNGVVNVLTKSSRDTQGLLASVGGGNLEPVRTAVRYGGRISETTTYRVYGKFSETENFVLPDGTDAADRWSLGQGGIRVDWEPSAESGFTWQADAYGSSADQVFQQATLVPPDYVRRLETRVDASGADVVGRWTRQLGVDSQLSLQTSYDLSHQEASYYAFDIQTFDAEVQYQLPLGARNEFVCGAEYRRVWDRLDGGFNLALVPETRATDLASVFVQDSLQVVPERVVLTLGTKAEHNAFTGFEVQPGARLAWTPADRHTVWASVARAVRTPSRSEDDLFNHARTLPPSGPGLPPSVATFVGSRGFESEELLAYELGYRFRPLERVSLDVATFYNVYDSLRTIDPGGAETGSLPDFVTLPLRPHNELEGESYGVELGAAWQVAERVRLRTGYTFLQVQLHRKAGATDPTAETLEGTSPDHQVFGMVQFDLPHHVLADVGVRYVDRLVSIGVPGYTAIDVRVAWEPRPGWQIAAIGQNLADDRHPEFAGTSLNGSLSSEVPRSFFVKLTWRY